jgi:hypothetical protein
MAVGHLNLLKDANTDINLISDLAWVEDDTKSPGNLRIVPSTVSNRRHDHVATIALVMEKSLRFIRLLLTLIASISPPGAEHFLWQFQLRIVNIWFVEISTVEEVRGWLNSVIDNPLDSEDIISYYTGHPHGVRTEFSNLTFEKK